MSRIWLQNSQIDKTSPVLKAGLSAMLYYLAARFGIAIFSLEPGNITLLWLPSGIGLVMCLRFGHMALPLIALASYFANFPGMSANGHVHAVLATFLSACSDAVASAIAAYAMRRLLPNGLGSAADLLRFGGAVCLPSSAVGGLLIGLDLTWFDYLPAANLPGFVRVLTLADSLGILLIYPLFQECRHYNEWPNADEWQHLLLALCYFVALSLLAFGGHPGFIYLLAPMLVWVVFHVRPHVVCSLLTISMIGLILLTRLTPGPFAHASRTETEFMLTAFVCMTTFITLGIALHNRELLVSDAAHYRWKQLARHDPLTGLLNRAGFFPILNEEHERVRRTGNPYALVMLDIDFFKQINDRYGHASGDEVLKGLAILMGENTRAIDKIGRLGGEEFAILFPESDAASAAVSMERLRVQLQSKPLATTHADIAVTISIGISEYRGDGKIPEAILELADQRLYAAKNNGRNQIVCA